MEDVQKILMALHLLYQLKIFHALFLVSSNTTALMQKYLFWEQFISDCLQLISYMHIFLIVDADS